jgi:hypothetical protein
MACRLPCHVFQGSQAQRDTINIFLVQTEHNMYINSSLIGKDLPLPNNPILLSLKSNVTVTITAAPLLPTLVCGFAAESGRTVRACRNARLLYLERRAIMYSMVAYLLPNNQHTKRELGVVDRFRVKCGVQNQNVLLVINFPGVS